MTLRHRIKEIIWHFSPSYKFMEDVLGIYRKEFDEPEGLGSAEQVDAGR